MLRERIEAAGHETVRATHESTLEITSDDWLTQSGDCIVGIEADRSPAAFDDRFVAAAQSNESELLLTLEAAGCVDHIRGQGHQDLTFGSDRCLVARTSGYVDDRTVMIEADKAAADLGRNLVTVLREGCPLSATLTVDR